MTRLPPVTQVTLANVPTSWHRMAMLLSSVLLVLAMMAALARGAHANEGQEAADFVRDFSNRAIVMLSDESLDQEARIEEFRQLLTAGFHLELIGKFVLGRHWRRASEAERAEFAQLFEDYLVASYAQKLSEYGGEKLVVQGGRPKGKSGAVVASRVVPPEGAPFQVEWRLRRAGDDWRIIDVVVEGVSMAVTQRSEFSSVIASRGGKIDGLLDALRRQIQQADSIAARGRDEAS
jgi:phospholipid transport system substrate-binding protein